MNNVILRKLMKARRIRRKCKLNTHSKVANGILISHFNAEVILGQMRSVLHLFLIIADATSEEQKEKCFNVIRR